MLCFCSAVGRHHGAYSFPTTISFVSFFRKQEVTQETDYIYPTKLFLA